MSEIKALEWREDWGGSLDDIPEWRAKTPWGSVTVSIAGYRDENGRPYERHSHVPEELKTRLIAERQSDYEARIRSALISFPGKEMDLRCVGGDCEYSKAVSMPEYQCVGKCQYEGDHTAGRKLSLWFFRDLSGEQRGKLFGLFGMKDAQKDTNHGYQAMALSQVVRALSASPSPVDSRDAREVSTGVLNGMLLARAPDCRWTIASILKERGLNYRQRLDYMRAALSAAFAAKEQQP